MNIEKTIVEQAEREFNRSLSEMDAAQLHNAVSRAVMRHINADYNACCEKKAQEKTAFYLSAEFLVGRVVFSNLLNLGLLQDVQDALKKHGADIASLEEIEDAALGNGGLGRLAACFLDSAATLEKNVDGYGIRYRYGLFKQKFEDGFQKEVADDWQRFGDPWSIRRESEKQRVEFYDGAVYAVPYDMPVVGYGGKRINTLRLWQSEPLTGFDFAKFDKNDYRGSVRERMDAERISAVLYHNDNEKKGKELRLKQEYFFSSASLQDILAKFEKTGKPYAELPSFAVVQLNDTHPVIAVPELIRLLGARGVSFSDALTIAKKTFAYTNHTVMQEALEKWDVRLMRRLLPDVYKTVVSVDAALKRELKARGETDEGRRIVDGGSVHMARLACYVGFAVNGVAKIHTEILKTDTLKKWYDLYPEKFFNKTNGITQRRWLALCNPRLSAFITERIGDKWITDLDELKALQRYGSDKQSLTQFARIKRENKRALAAFIEKKEGVRLNENFIFDVQIKRLHEYKRQLLNALSVVAIYKGLKDGKIRDFKPTAFLFGAKAAPGYFRAKGVIKYINEIAALVNNDAAVNDVLKVVFVTDYNVSYAEKLVAAGEVSEQISAAGTEASGTGNMKLMLNGAVTLGTFDGANIEIAEAAGEENNYIFGARVEELRALQDAYCPAAIYESNPVLKAAADTLTDGTFSDGGTGMFRELYDSLLKGASWHRADPYFLFQDFSSYLDAKLRVNADYGTEDFTRKCLVNVANAGRFSSDRTISEYCDEIWKI